MTETVPETAPAPAARAFIDVLVEQLTQDQRFAGAWLTGSFGAGTADRYSDVDTAIAVRDADFEQVVHGWQTFAQTLAPMVHVLQRRFGPAGPVLFNHVSAEWLRFDALVLRSSESSTRVRAGAVRTLVDRGCQLAPAAGPAPLDPAAAEAAIREFLRVLGLTPVVLGRHEYVTAASGSALLRDALIALLRMRVEGSTGSGALHLARILPADELADLATLPAITATRESAIAVGCEVARRYLPVARQVLGSAFPQPMADACARWWERELGTVPPGLAVGLQAAEPSPRAC